MAIRVSLLSLRHVNSAPKTPSGPSQYEWLGTIHACSTRSITSSANCPRSKSFSGAIFLTAVEKKEVWKKEGSMDVN